MSGRGPVSWLGGTAGRLRRLVSRYPGGRVWRLVSRHPR